MKDNEMLDEMNMGEFVPPSIKCFKIWETAHLPEYSTTGSACFDIKASLVNDDTVKTFKPNNEKYTKTVENNRITIYSGERVLVPTGIIFDLEPNQSIRIHPRSGLSLKNGIVIANCEGVVDSDYVEQSYVMLLNISDVPFDVDDGMRIAQGEVSWDHPPLEIIEIKTAPEVKTDRNGGFGSTGI